MMRRGEIWIANLNPNKGSEIRNIRPVLVMQTNEVTEAGLRTILVVPLTTRHWPGLEPMRVRISARDRLQMDSWAMAEQVKAIDRIRFGDGPLAVVTRSEMAAVEKSLQAVLGML